MAQVVIGVDPHKRSATIEVIDQHERVLGKGRTQIVRWVSRYGIDVRSCGPE